MAITSPSNRRMAYSPVASTGPFPIDFPVFDGTGADLEVRLNDVVVAGWTFTGALDGGFYGQPNTWVNGSISFAAPQTGDLVIYGLRAPRRQIAFQEGRGVPARDLNAELDTLTAVDQELRRDIGEVREGLDDLNAAVVAAAGSAAAAAISATNAANSYDAFDDRYLGDKTVLPGLDNDGNALQVGALCFLKDQIDPANNGLYRWDGFGWDKISDNPIAFERAVDVIVDSTIASTGVVPISGGYVPGINFQAQRNGAGLREGPSPGLGEGDDDYTADNGTTAVFAIGYLSIGDWLRFSIRRPYQVGIVEAADATLAPIAGMTAGNAQAGIEELQASKAALAGATFTGPVIVPAPTLGGHAVTKSYADALVGGAQNPAEQIVNSGAPAAAGSLDVALTGGHRRYRLVVDDIAPVVDNQGLLGRISIDNAATYRNGASDYQQGGRRDDSGGGNASYAVGAGNAWQLSRGLPVGNAYGSQLEILITPGKAGLPTVISWTFSYVVAGSGVFDHLRVGGKALFNGVPTHFRLVFNSGNIAAGMTWQLYGLRHTP